MLTISGANWFGRRAGTCRLHAIYEPTVYLCGESGRNCQVRLGAPSSPGDSGSHISNADLVLPIQYAHHAAPSRRALRLLASRASQKDPRHGNASPGVGWLRAALPRGLSRAPTPLAPFKCSRLYRSGHTSPLINSDGCGTISATFQLCPVSFWRSRLIVRCAEAASGKLQAFRLDPSPALGWHMLQVDLLPFHPREAALAFRVTTTTSKPTCLLRRLQHTR